jgi:hypothetical protein
MNTYLQLTPIEMGFTSTSYETKLSNLHTSFKQESDYCWNVISEFMNSIILSQLNNAVTQWSLWMYDDAR